MSRKLTIVIANDKYVVTTYWFNGIEYHKLSSTVMHSWTSVLRFMRFYISDHPLPWVIHIRHKYFANEASK